MIRLKVSVVRKEGDLLEVEVEGETHTILNLISTKLLEYDEVEIAGYDVPHPLHEKGKLIVRAKKGDPVDLLIKGIDDLINEFERLKEDLKEPR